MKASLIISFILHVIIVLVFQNAFPSYWSSEKLRTYRVELIRPPVEDIDTDDSPGTQVDSAQAKEKNPSEESQDTISLDTKDKRYISYASTIKNEIMRHWKYPAKARASLIEGSLRVLFSLKRNGGMIDINITSSSGHAILDKEVVRAINRAVPFPPFPASIKVERLNIKAMFDYRLTSGKRGS